VKDRSDSISHFDPFLIVGVCLFLNRIYNRISMGGTFSGTTR